MANLYGGQGMPQPIQGTDSHMMPQNTALVPDAVRRVKRKPDHHRKATKHTVLRQGAGKVWDDPTLVEWNPNHFRLFCGNLGGEVHDEILYRAFSKYMSLQKARVIRDKKTTKSKGFGFVSFSDPNDFIQAWRDMNGKYIGSHPVKLSKADTPVESVTMEWSRLSKKLKNGKDKSIERV
jgi:hypothetical protein